MMCILFLKVGYPVPTILQCLECPWSTLRVLSWWGWQGELRNSDVFAAKLLNIAETNSVNRRLMHKPNRVKSNLDSLRQANDVGTKCLPTLLILGEVQSKEYLPYL